MTAHQACVRTEGNVWIRLTDSSVNVLQASEVNNVLRISMTARIISVLTVSKANIYQFFICRSSYYEIVHQTKYLKISCEFFI